MNTTSSPAAVTEVVPRGGARGRCVGGGGHHGSSSRSFSEPVAHRGHRAEEDTTTSSGSDDDDDNGKAMSESSTEASLHGHHGHRRHTGRLESARSSGKSDGSSSSRRSSRRKEATPAPHVGATLLLEPLLLEMRDMARQSQQSQQLQQSWFLQQMSTVGMQVASLAQQLQETAAPPLSSRSHRSALAVGVVGDPFLPDPMRGRSFPTTGPTILSQQQSVPVGHGTVPRRPMDPGSPPKTPAPSVAPSAECCSGAGAAAAAAGAGVGAWSGGSGGGSGNPLRELFVAQQNEATATATVGRLTPALPSQQGSSSTLLSLPLSLPDRGLAPTLDYNDNDDELLGVKNDAALLHPREWQLYPPRSYSFRINRRHIVPSKKTFPYERLMGPTGSVMIAITMYNETWEQLQSTLVGVIRNLAKWEKEYGRKIQSQIVLLVIVDGRSHMDADTRQKLGDIGFINLQALDRPIVATTTTTATGTTPIQVNVDDVIHCFYTRALYTHAHSQYGPLQVMFVIKEKNGGKLDSHKVFLDGLCARCKPEFVILLDCGTIPAKHALFKLYDAMAHDEKVGGCAGEIEALRDWGNPVVTGQAFEYKIAHILDKSAESVLGFISVLPGAFSAYRYRALTEPDSGSGESPLNKYFAGMDCARLGPFMSNIYLAEDRILCFELMARRGTSYVLAYVPGALATCDVPESTADLLKQRKRWLNGALFALFYCFMHARQFYSSGLSYARKVSITCEMGMLTVLTLLNLLGPGTFYIIFRMVVVSVLTERSTQVGLAPSVGSQLANILNYSLMFVLLIQLIFGLGNSQPTHIRAFYGATLVYFSFFQVILVGFGIFFVIYTNDWLVWTSFALLFGLYPFAAFIHCPSDTWKVLLALPFYLLLIPLFIIVLPIRAFANIHDISWGTKGLEQSSVESRKDNFQRFRSVFLLTWVSANIFFAAVILQLHSSYSSFGSGFLRGLFILAGGINVFRTLCLMLLRFSNLCCLGTANMARRKGATSESHSNSSRCGSGGGSIALSNPTAAAVGALDGDVLSSHRSVFSSSATSSSPPTTGGSARTATVASTAATASTAAASASFPSPPSASSNSGHSSSSSSSTSTASKRSVSVVVSGARSLVGPSQSQNHPPARVTTSTASSVDVSLV